jgi:hypothetical protein
MKSMAVGTNKHKIDKDLQDQHMAETEPIIKEYLCHEFF